MDCNIDVKQEEDPLLFIEIKTEPHDFESEIKTEAEYDDTHVKHELLSVPSVVVSNKTSSEVEKTEENLGKMLEDCENQSQNTQVNLDNFFMVACGPSEINSFGLLKEEKFDLGVNEHTEENNDIRSKIKTEVEEYEGTDIRFEQFPVHDLDTSGRTISEVQERRESFNKLSEDCEKQTQNAQVDPGKSFTAASNAVELKEEKFDVKETQESSHKLLLHFEKPSESTHVNITDFDTCERGAMQEHGVCVSDNTEENSVNNSPQTAHGSLKCSVGCQCNFCYKSFLNKSHPSKKASVNPMTCDVCTDLCIHNNTKLHVRNLCNKSYSQKSQITTHLRIHNNEKSYQCNLCKKSFTEKSSLTKHIKRTHNGEKSYKCNICNKSFTLIYDLTRHLDIHNIEKRYVCDVCNKSFTQKSHFNAHLRIHNNEKPYVCKICNKAFTQKQRHTLHLRFHNNEKPYECDVCNKSFTYKSHLTSHLRIHNNEKPYECDVCNKSFTEKSSLTKHIKRTHNGENPYKCNICNKSFTLTYDLTRHLHIHNIKKPYVCDVCKKSFIKKSTLTKHIKCNHSGKKPNKWNVCNK